jgi:AcrR family transcriptional regulator
VATETRDRIVAATAELFRRHGYAGTGLKAILGAANAPYGSLYHFFPGGKEELGAETIRVSGVTYRELVEAYFPEGVDVAAATGEFFAGAAEFLRTTDFVDACPIATVALEVSSESEPMRVAAAEAFESWLAVLEQRLTEAGIAHGEARELAVELFCLLEGAFVHARATRTTEALETTGRRAVASVEATRRKFLTRRSSPT